MCLCSLLRMMRHWYSQGEDCFELICQNFNCVFTLHLMFSQTCPDREERTTACYVITFLRFWANRGKFKAGASYARGEESKFPSFGFFLFLRSSPRADSHFPLVSRWPPIEWKTQKKLCLFCRPRTCFHKRNCERAKGQTKTWYQFSQQQIIELSKFLIISRFTEGIKLCFVDCNSTELFLSHFISICKATVVCKMFCYRLILPLLPKQAIVKLLTIHAGSLVIETRFFKNSSSFKTRMLILSCMELRSLN